MRYYCILILFLLYTINNFSQNFPFKLGRNQVFQSTDAYPCEIGVKVQDNRPTDCTFGNDFYMYKVFEENFDYREELPNNWRFTLDFRLDDNYKGTNPRYRTFVGGKSFPNNDNLYINNGICYLEFKKEQTLNVDPVPWDLINESNNYDFTGAFLNSFFHLRQGVFEARIKFPNNQYFWPSFWLYNIQEIDVCEFWDETPIGGPSHAGFSCDSYHHSNMSLHGRIDQNLNVNYNGDGLTKCIRTRKFGLPLNFFNDYHTYKCVWTDYKVHFYLDGTLVGTVSKYYDSPFLLGGVCHESTGGTNVPAYHRDCNYMTNSPDCQVRIKVPNWPDVWNFHYECVLYNYVKKDLTFPSSNIPMKMIISNSFNHLSGPGGDDLKSNLGNFADDNRRIGVDWVRVYQPVKCNSQRYVASINDFKYYTENTNFLSGSTIQLGNGANAYLENSPDDNFPIHILASEEIKFLGDMHFPEHSYLRAEIIDCGSGFNQYQRTTENGGKLFLTDEEVAALEQNQNDSLMKYDSAYRDSILAYNNRIEQYKKMETISEIDNGAINLYPNPTENILQIEMMEEDYYDLYSIDIIDNLGREFSIEKSKHLDVTFLTPGFYEIKFKFSHGFVVVKNFVKK